MFIISAEEPVGIIVYPEKRMALSRYPVRVANAFKVISEVMGTGPVYKALAAVGSTPFVV